MCEVALWSNCSTEDGDEFLIGIEYGESFLDKDTVDKTSQFTTERFGGRRFIRDIEEIRPYLRPMSSMTKEERFELLKKTMQLALQSSLGLSEFVPNTAVSAAFEIDYYNAHHFDYRGLIEKGLALEAKEGMYKAEAL